MNTNSNAHQAKQKLVHSKQESTADSHLFLANNLHKRTKCLVYTRVMGYHRPVESFNSGKQGEHKERRFFEHL
jgi:anaerobic ribonucleoside-triphosphate reductase